VQVSFREELHAIESVIAGQGIATCSDILIASELRDGRLVALRDLMLPGYGFHAAWRQGHPKAGMIRALAEWLHQEFLGYSRQPDRTILSALRD
jgi:LysR family transcriptional regulator, glycine cleavage system transcriptional activator